MEITYQLDRVTEEGEEVLSATLVVKGSYDAGEAEGCWGRYGSTPGMSESIDIESLEERREVAGPHRLSPWLGTTPRGPVVYYLPFEVELTEDEEAEVKELLMQCAVAEMESAAEDRAGF